MPWSKSVGTIARDKAIAHPFLAPRIHPFIRIINKIPSSFRETCDEPQPEFHWVCSFKTLDTRFLLPPHSLVLLLLLLPHFQSFPLLPLLRFLGCRDDNFPPGFSELVNSLCVTRLHLPAVAIFHGSEELSTKLFGQFTSDLSSQNFCFDCRLSFLIRALH